MRRIALLLLSCLGSILAQGIPVVGGGGMSHAISGGTTYYSRSFTIDHTKVPNTDQADFPVLIRSLIGTVNTTSVANAVTLTAGDTFPAYMTTGYPIRIASAVYTIATRVNGSALTLSTSPGIQTSVAYNSTPFWATVANGGALTNASGYDNIFGTSSTCGTKYDWEREFWSATTGEGVFWVRIPTLATASDTVPYNCYGNATITTDQSNSTAAWNSDFKLVAHFPDGSSLTTLDSTSTANNGTNTAATALAGQIDGGASFNGTSAQVNFGSGATLNVGSTTTMSCWVDRGAAGTETWILVKRAGVNGYFFYINGSDNLALYLFGSSVSSSGTVSATGWQHVAATFGSGTVSYYINGAASGSGSLSAGVDAGGGAYMGTVLDSDGNPAGYSAQYFDECHVSNVVRSGDWIATEYNNQSAPAAFYAVGSEVSH